MSDTFDVFASKLAGKTDKYAKRGTGTDLELSFHIPFGIPTRVPAFYHRPAYYG
jgi:hypothetical protein